MYPCKGAALHFRKVRSIYVVYPELIAELEILALFNLDSTQEGLKVHATAAPQAIAAAKRLFSKELITQEDGGYLTRWAAMRRRTYSSC